MPMNNDKMNAYMKQRYKLRRELAIETLGGFCINCGSDEELEIDHIEREGRPYTQKFSKFWNIALDRFMEELTKCQLLCETCHSLKTSDDLGVAHGGGLSGKRNCKCPPCRGRKREYMKDRY